MVVVGIMSSCSDDTPTTGTICIVFSSWEREWNKQVTFTVRPIEKEDYIIKTAKLDIFKKNYIEVNPGNYIVDCQVQSAEHPKYFLLTSSLKKHAFYNLLINNILYLCVT